MSYLGFLWLQSNTVNKSNVEGKDFASLTVPYTQLIIKSREGSHGCTQVGTDCEGCCLLAYSHRLLTLLSYRIQDH